MAWAIPWYSTSRAFNDDHGVTGGSGLNVFLRDGGEVYRTYFTNGRGVEALGSVWTFLDLTPLGRQESWEDAPDGYPKTPPYEWWHLHDEYHRREPSVRQGGTTFTFVTDGIESAVAQGPRRCEW